jgi:hypothetical protein
MATFIVNKFLRILYPYGTQLCLVALIFHTVFVPCAHKHPVPVAVLISLLLLIVRLSAVKKNNFLKQSLIRVPDHLESDIFPAAEATRNPPKR